MKKHNIVTKKRVAGAVASVAAISLLLGGTFAWNDFTQHKTNALAAGDSFEVTLNDSFTPPSEWTVGSDVSKAISVTSTTNSSSAAYVRLQIKEYLEAKELEVVTDNGTEVLFATYADGAGIGEYMTWADAQAGGYNYTQFTVDGVDYARTQNAELRNGIYGKHMYLYGDEVVYGTAAKADYPNQAHEQQSADNPECKYNVHAWNTCGITAPNGDTIHNHITWSLGTQTMLMADWLAAGRHTGDFWVLDTDGWAYWANAVPANYTTANLMESVLLNNAPGNEFEYYIHVDMEAVTVDELDLFTSNGATTDGQQLIEELKKAGTGWTDNGDGTATQYLLVDGTLTAGLTTIIGLDGIPGTADDNQLVNPAGTVIQTGVTPVLDTGAGKHYVDIGNGFHLYPGTDGKIGTTDDVVQGFGSYAQSDSTGTNKDPMNWRLLDIKNGQAVLVSATVIDEVNYAGALQLLGTNWSDSYYRTWLNGTFYNTAFTATEKGKIAQTSVQMPEENVALYLDLLGSNLVTLKIGAEPSTTDNVFALSISETYRYFGQSAPGKTNAVMPGNAYSLAEGTAHVGGATGTARWRTRSGGGLLTNNTIILANGYATNALSLLSNNVGALPAITVNLVP